ncbi:MAG: hypothetical protein QNJ17_15710 [Desulfocapsaceae bacterium]|nr:hypothetical protein [Desulfocapsaceae bacterium]
MRQISQTIIIFFLTVLLTSLAPAGQLPGLACQDSETAANNMPACCKTVTAMAESSTCADSSAVDNHCPQGGWCQVDASLETYWRTSGGLHHFDYEVQNLAVIAQSVSPMPVRPVLSGLSPPVRGSTPRYILICSFLI